MAAVATNESNSIAIKVQTGTSSTGNVIAANVNVTGLKSTEFTSQDIDKAYALISAMADVITYNIIGIYLTTRKEIKEA